MDVAWRDAAGGAAAAAAVGFVVNILQLGVPLYTLQIYDRVIASRSLETLTVLTALVLGLLLFLGILDFARARLFQVSAERLMCLLDGQALAAAMRARLRGDGAAAEALRDLEELRRFLAHGPVALPVDLAMAPLFLLVLTALDPVYGVVGLAAIALLTGLAAAVDLLGRRPTRRGEERHRAARLDAMAAVRQAEAIEALGMLDALVGRWRGSRREVAACCGARRVVGARRLGRCPFAADGHPGGDARHRRHAGDRPSGHRRYYLCGRNPPGAGAVPVRAADRWLAAVGRRPGCLASSQGNHCGERG